ncbi:MAG: carboxylesterase/lipase family protein [Candidatus Acidiferrales bacterium]
MKAANGIFAVTAVLALACASAVCAQTSRPLRTQTGLVQGTVVDGVRVFEGIPFAAPPLGALRWLAPQPAKSWKGVKKTDAYAPACMQIPIVEPALGLDAVAVSEDCLYLNVWTPAHSAGARLPVMVWIYGGGFTIGATSMGQYDGVNLAKKGVILVSVAYRLGPLGFLADPQLTKEQGGHSGNYGLLDQIAGLKWVKRNIAAFGGNPNKVTIFGESAGGISVSMLCASPLAQGLFEGAISESGGSFSPALEDHDAGENVPTLAEAEKTGEAFISKLGASSIADARKIPAADLYKKVGGGLGGWWPNFDGYVLLGDQYKLYEEGKYNDTPILVGTNADEGALFVASTDMQKYKASVENGYGEFARNILAAYPDGSQQQALRSARDLARDSTFAWATWSWAKLQASTGKDKVFVYYFNHRPQYPDLPRFKDWGPAHGSEISYVFGNFTKGMPATPEDKVVSEQLMSYWTNFAKYGNPNGKGLPEWPAFTNAKQQYMELDTPSKAIPVPNLDKLKALDGYFAWRRKQESSQQSGN